MSQLRYFSLDDADYVKKHSSRQTWIPGRVTEKTDPLSYKTITPNSKSIRCHIDQMKNRKTPLVSSQFHQKLKRIQLVLLPLQCNRPAQTFQLSRVIFQLKSTPKKASNESHQNRPRRTIIRSSNFKDYFIWEECCDLFLLNS
ncbi:hypothetical protein AVEN_226123-1 [Araneus ventricosus]|uniref:Uncharacterized protein n=1 Tax=Araneus ventricosus TaxID=182803 RepID=A0A4Y2V9D1_ARAVE|nr:hypothetical protein AVEN_226123-1 [Araneus ventricosus]